MTERSRIERFVRSARTLLTAQAAAAAGATALAVWAAVEVKGMVDAKEELAARVAELEQARPAGPLADPRAGPLEAPAEPLTQTVRPPVESGGTEEGGGSDDAKGPPPPPQCRALDGRAIDCVPPFRRFPNSAVCLDGNQQRMQCPPGVEEAVETPPPPPPPPERACRNALGRAVECVPPFRATPRAGFCLDGRMRLVRCPPGEPAREQQQESGRPPVD